MDQQHRNRDLRSRGDWAGGIDREVASLFRQLEGTCERIGSEKERRSFGCNSPEIGERLGGDDPSDPNVFGRKLECDSRSQRRPEQHNRTGVDSVEDATEVLLLPETIGAHITARIAVRAAVVCDDIQTEFAEAANSANTAAAIVRDAVKVDERATTGPRSPTLPPGQLHIRAGKDNIATTVWCCQRKTMTHWVQQPTCAEHRQLTRHYSHGDYYYQAQPDHHEPCPGTRHRDALRRSPAIAAIGTSSPGGPL